jgi:hypothetical protein
VISTHRVALTSLALAQQMQAGQYLNMPTPSMHEGGAFAYGDLAVGAAPADPPLAGYNVSEQVAQQQQMQMQQQQQQQQDAQQLMFDPTQSQHGSYATAQPNNFDPSMSQGSHAQQQQFFDASVSQRGAQPQFDPSMSQGGQHFYDAQQQQQQQQQQFFDPSQSQGGSQWGAVRECESASCVVCRARARVCA